VAQWKREALKFAVPGPEVEVPEMPEVLEGGGRAGTGGTMVATSGSGARSGSSADGRGTLAEPAVLPVPQGLAPPALLPAAGRMPLPPIAPSKAPFKVGAMGVAGVPVAREQQGPRVPPFARPER